MGSGFLQGMVIRREQKGQLCSSEFLCALAQKRWHFLAPMQWCAAVSALWPENREQMDGPGLKWGVYSYPHDSEYSSLLFDGGTQSKLGRCLLSMGEAPFAWVSRCQRTKANRSHIPALITLYGKHTLLHYWFRFLSIIASFLPRQRCFSLSGILWYSQLFLLFFNEHHPLYFIHVNSYIFNLIFYQLKTVIPHSYWWVFMLLSWASMYT